jgi:membrane-associated protein
MTHLSLDQIIALLIQYKYWLLFPIVVFEGPIITIIAGFLTSLGYLNFIIAYVLIVFADLVGDVIYYYFGRFGREHFINRWGRYLGITMERVKKLEKHFGSHTGKTLILGKLSHAVGGYILVAAGIAKVPLKDFIKYNFIATWPKSMILFLIGYYFGRSYYQISKYLDYTAWGTIALVIILILVYFVMKSKAEKGFK